MGQDLFDDEMFEDEEAAARHGRRDRPGGASRRRGETAKRILVALPWIVFAVSIVVVGGTSSRSRWSGSASSACASSTG